MTKSDLKSGMAIELRCGERFLLVEIGKELYALNESGCGLISEYRNDLTSLIMPEYDILKIWEGKHYFLFLIKDLTDETAFWIRGDTKEITVEEAFRILKNHYGCDVKIMEG